MTTPFVPVPGLVTPNPIGWGAGNIITTPRLRGDCTNMAALMAGGGRPLLSAECGIQSVSNNIVTGMQLTAQAVNTWQVPVITSPTTSLYKIPFGGYYLVQANVMFPGPASVQAKYAMGFSARSLGVGPSNSDGGAVPANTTAALIGAAGAELYQFDPFSLTSDTVAFYAFQNSGSTISNTFGSISVEWVGVNAAAGTVVAAPVPAVTWPSGAGTYIISGSGITAGATTVFVADPVGMIVGGTIGLDYVAGQLAQPTAERVTITSITGLNIGISATQYPHAFLAPVAVPVSGVLLNQQVRDAIRFLSYPPMLRAATTTTQSIASGTAGVQITNLAATTDNFSGFASNQYTVPVSGLYFVYGQVYYAGSTAAFAYSAGVSVSGGTIQWGASPRSGTTSGAQTLCATVRRHLRLTAGQTVQLFGYQNSGSAMNTVSPSNTLSRLIIVFRGF